MLDDERAGRTVSDEIDRGPEQIPLFENPPAWTDVWQGMPTFNQKDLTPFDSINVQFRNDADRRAFLSLLGEPLDRKRSIWFPKMEILKQSQRQITPTLVAINQYPIYIISKGRWEYHHTARALEMLSIPYRIIIEVQEYDRYASVIDPSKILVLPFSNLGQGSIPARNWVWEHALESGAARHWILDDNIDGFYRLNENKKVKVVDSNPFLDAERFCDRYTNVALAGLNYEFFADRRSQSPPCYLNTRIYSCILIQNDIPFRWRGRYNEDTDLSIRVLKAGYCTVLFNMFLAKKLPTMTVKGGNTDELYQGDGRLLMAQSLKEQHPEIVKITRKWGRWQHQVDYSGFRKNHLIARPGVTIPETPDDFGMSLEIDDDAAEEA